MGIDVEAEQWSLQPSGLQNQATGMGRVCYYANKIAVPRIENVSTQCVLLFPSILRSRPAASERAAALAKALEEENREREARQRAFVEDLRAWEMQERCGNSVVEWLKSNWSDCRVFGYASVNSPHPRVHSLILAICHHIAQDKIEGTGAGRGAGAEPGAGAGTGASRGRRLGGERRRRGALEAKALWKEVRREFEEEYLNRRGVVSLIKISGIGS